MEAVALVGGRFVGQAYDKYGNKKGDPVFAKNLVHTTGLNDLCDTYLGNGTQITQWYVGLKNAGTIAAGDTLASHAGWAENSNYTGDRKAYTIASASGGSVTNTASKASFAINTDSQSIAGAFLCSVATTTTGILFCTADFASAKALDDGDTFEVTYVFTAADDGA